MTLEELQKEMDKLPSEDPNFLVGWLMAQVIHLSKELEEVNEKET